jgi:hypothetical protein
MNRYQVRVLHRVNGNLETHISTVEALSKAAATRQAKQIAAELDGRLWDVIPEDELNI